MMIKIGVFGYGNLGKGIENAVPNFPDMKLSAIFTRRNPKDFSANTVPIVSAKDLSEWKGKLDVIINCGGSAKDLPETTPALARFFNVVDSYDNHAEIQNHFKNIHQIAKDSGTAVLISCGWDPGLFSLARIYAKSVLPRGKEETFWGRGVSQGHSDAIRQIPGVLDAKQYTVPIPAILEQVKNGSLSDSLPANQKHRRECFVVAKPGANLEEIRKKIQTFPNYFLGYQTNVHFISKEEMEEKHSEFPHGGSVFYIGKTGEKNRHCQKIEYSLQLDSNPEFTASVLLAFARALCRMRARGETGCKTVFDVAPKDLFPSSDFSLLANYL